MVFSVFPLNFVVFFFKFLYEVNNYFKDLIDYDSNIIVHPKSFVHIKYQ